MGTEYEKGVRKSMKKDNDSMTTTQLNADKIGTSSTNGHKCTAGKCTKERYSSSKEEGKGEKVRRIEPGRIYTTAQIGSWIGVRREVIERACRRNELHSRRIGRAWRITGAAATAWVEGR